MPLEQRAHAGWPSSGRHSLQQRSFDRMGTPVYEPASFGVAAMAAPPRTGYGTQVYLHFLQKHNPELAASMSSRKSAPIRRAQSAMPRVRLHPIAAPAAPAAAPSPSMPPAAVAKPPLSKKVTKKASKPSVSTIAFTPAPAHAPVAATPAPPPPAPAKKPQQSGQSMGGLLSYMPEKPIEEGNRIPAHIVQAQKMAENAVNCRFANMFRVSSPSFESLP